MIESRDEFCERAIPPGTRSVLDVGCGGGRVLASLDRVPRRVGVDTDTALLATARTLSPACEFLPVDGAQLPFGDGDFDAVILSEVLEHVGDANKGRVMDEVLRVVRPGGRIVITCPHRGPLSRLDPLDYKRSMPLLYALYRRVRPGRSSTAAEIGHVGLTMAEIEALLRGRARIERLALGGPLAPLMANVMALLVLLGASDAARFRWAAIQDREQSVPAPAWFAHALRLVATRVAPEALPAAQEPA